ncbi:hypothetical protein CUT44_20010 [Streptomyces carminius]|uniref:Uncharacterized protein n=1 Tax=Streptomyces carminius TaxID=2665496 RepID=A0A2M8LVZ1_9ACTN|nr:hypothetical protein CUT44_20010 [Streptomyces carminius]
MRPRRGGRRRRGAGGARVGSRRAQFADQGHRSAGAVLALFSPHGFHPDVVDAAARRRDVLLVGIGALYGGEPVRGPA